MATGAPSGGDEPVHGTDGASATRRDGERESSSSHTTHEAKEALRVYFRTLTLTRTSKLPRKGASEVLDNIIKSHYCLNRRKAGYQLRKYKEEQGFVPVVQPNAATTEEIAAWIEDARTTSFHDLWQRAVELFAHGSFVERNAIGEFDIEALNRLPDQATELEAATLKKWDAIMSEVRADPLELELGIRRVRSAIAALVEDTFIVSFHLHTLAINKRRECAIELVMALEQAWREDISPKKELEVVPVGEGKSDEISHDLVYYLAGWLLAWLARRARSLEVRSAIASARVTRECAREQKLPSMLTEARERYDGLSYPDKSFFEVVLRLETIFNHHLTLENVIGFGRNVIRVVKNHALDDQEFKRLLPSKFEVSSKLIVEGFCRMRGKDFTCKLRMYKKDNDSNTTRGRLSALADEARRRATALMNEEDVDDGNESAD